ncbi:hypothetical protein C5B85_09720 [Pseudoclavibacter sp. AY1F1]|uniref:hypothetical protein n=1 Tax=Pseudoclavibacter sp. AY1F1 TaxID=2080583 RepID=UPI000CE7E62E|nr:hypothetical protein [Pseudoclavibacter sp. AY1F1]PPF44422.1 hypothetical protein C5B85_09720 [Pseudoclavibacter sp. AY1F1]
MPFLVTVDDRAHYVEDDAMPTLRHVIVDAVRQGGDLVRFPARGRLERWELITTASSVSMREVPGATAEEDDGAPFADISFYDFES